MEMKQPSEIKTNDCDAQAPILTQTTNEYLRKINKINDQIKSISSTDLQYYLKNRTKLEKINKNLHNLKQEIKKINLPEKDKNKLENDINSTNKNLKNI